MGIAGVASTCLIALRDVPRFASRALLAMFIVSALGVAGIVEAEREAAGVSVGAAVLDVARHGCDREDRCAGGGRGRDCGCQRCSAAPARTHRPSPSQASVQRHRCGSTLPRATRARRRRLSSILLPSGRTSSQPGCGSAACWCWSWRFADSRPRSKGRAVRRFSTTAGIAIVVVALTGTFRAIIEVGSIGQLFGTAFGVLVLVKVALFVVLAALGAINRYGNVPRASRVLPRFAQGGVDRARHRHRGGAGRRRARERRAASRIRRAATTAKATQLVVTGSDFATTVKVRLAVSPGTAGFQQLRSSRHRLRHGCAGATQRRCSSSSRSRLRPQLGQSTLTLKRQPDGTFAARGGNLAIAGIWEVAVIIENASNSAEVHLQLINDQPGADRHGNALCGAADAVLDPAPERLAGAGLHRPRQGRRRRVSCHLLHKLERDQRDSHRDGRPSA